MQVHSIPGKLNVKWQSDVKAIVDSWSNYSVSLDEFKESVLVKGLDFAKANGAVAWVVDSSAAEGVFSQEIQSFIGSDIFPAFAKNGIKYFITIKSEVNALTNLTVKTFSAKTGPHGLQLVELNNVNDAINWLKTNA